MHELSIALSILKVAEEEGGAGVEVIHVRVGELSGVVKEALLSAYEIAREGTPLRRARLVIEEVPVMVDCPRCKGPRRVLSIQQLRCADCQTPASRILEGSDLQVAALEVSS